MWKDFKQFVLRGNVVDLAVAVVVGAAFSLVVSSFVSGLLTPLIAAIFGKQDFSGLTFTINGSVFRYGLFLNALISFLLVTTAIFFLVVKPTTALMHRFGVLPEDEPPRKPCPECTSEIPEAARRCPECTAVLAQAA
jgi:large conductance mechanosensitive channel